MSGESTNADAFNDSLLHKHSCVLCQNRKVKCNRGEPCSGCRRAGKECVYREPPPPKRRPRKPQELGLHARVRRYEQLLVKFGVDLDSIGQERSGSIGSGGDGGGAGEARDVAGSHKTTPDHDMALGDDAAESVRPVEVDEAHRRQAASKYLRGQIIIKKDGSARYIEKSMFKDIQDDLAHGNHGDEALDSDEGDHFIGLPGKSDVYFDRKADTSMLIFGSADVNFDLQSAFPPPEVVMRLLAVYRENVDPLVKINHYPTVESMFKRRFQSQHPDQLSDGDTALCFTVLLFAVTTMTREDVQALTGTPRASIVPRLREATQVALTRAGLLRTLDLTTLQAYVLFVLAVRQYYDAHSLWILSGVGIRIASRMGLHRDGEGSKLTPFIVEMRRRTWWQTFVLDRTASEMSGTGLLSAMFDWDTKVPLSVNDEDLYPEMEELPPERPGATEMMYVRLRYEIGSFFKGTNPNHGWKPLMNPAVSIVEKEKSIQALQERIEEKFLRYCDPLQKTHFFTTVTARAILCTLYLIIHHPRNFGDQEIEPRQREVLFVKSLDIMSYGNLLQQDDRIQGFMWHINAFFTWQAFIFCLDHLLTHPMVSGADKAWQQIEQVYEYHPTLLGHGTNKLHNAVRKLTVRAWKAREQAYAGLGLTSLQQPDYIKSVFRTSRSQRTGEQAASAAAQNVPHAGTSYDPNAFGNAGGAGGVGSIDFSLNTQANPGAAVLPSPALTRTASDSVDATPLDWREWSDLIEWQDFNFDSVSGLYYNGGQPLGFQMAGGGGMGGMGPS